MVNLLALGPLELWHQGEPCFIGSPKERCVLATLLHARGEPVSVDTLMSRLWEDEDYPESPLGAMNTYLSRLRKRLRAAGDLAGVERIAPRLYRLRVIPEQVDLLRFQQLRAGAAAAAERGEHRVAVRLLREAEALWRGEPLAEFSGDWAVSARARLMEDLRRVREERIGLELERGKHADLIGELRELVTQNPFAQQAVGTLMLALYRSGRHDEALALYRDTHRRLDNEQGIQPGGELRELHRRMLVQDPALSPSAGGSDDVPVQKSGGAPGSNLPRDTCDFTGRKGELAALLVDSGDRRGDDDLAGPALPVTVVHGMPGVGKTATAVRAAYRLRERYPDGQFYVDLRGYSDQPQNEPGEALASLLRSSGIPGSLPDSLDERSARWREWTARHRALVVLDNARTAGQVRPLLPGASTCRAIVTSRNRLAGLDGATPLFLDALSVQEGMELFSRIAGAARATNTAALRRVVEACGSHPLALQLLATRYRHRASWDLDHLLHRLSEAADPLDEFDDGLALAFQLSYAELDPSAGRLFRRLSLASCPDTTLGAVTALLDTDVTGARRSVEELLDCHLLEEPVRDRYQLHDLVRAFALKTCRRDEPESSRRAATRRLLAYYLGSADRADRLAHPQRRRRQVLGTPPGQVSRYAAEFTDADEASVWLEVERSNLLAAARTAAAEAPDYAGTFPHVLAPSLKLWGIWDVTAELHGAAVAALRSGGDRRSLAHALTEHADVLAKKLPGEALRHASEALALFEEAHDVEGRANALFQLGRAQFAAGRGAVAREALSGALQLYRATGNRHGEAETLNVQGVALHLAGERQRAEECFLSVLALHRSSGDVHGQLRAMNNLGEFHRYAGRYEEARTHYEQSLALLRRVGGRQELANLYNNLGIVCQATGETEQALDYFRRALNSYRYSHDPLGESDTLISLGAAYASSGRHNEALWHYLRAERIARNIGNPDERQNALIGIGVAQRHLGRFDLAAENCKRALELAREADIPLGIAQALDCLARIAVVTQGADSARAFLEEAVDLYERLGETEKARALRQQGVNLGVTGS